jgi:alpha-1,3-rhamnosyl/mannosyltransferase
MRIALDASPLLLAPKAGVGRYTFHLASALLQLRDDSDVIFFYGTHWSDRLIDPAERHGDGTQVSIRKQVSALIPGPWKQWLRRRVLHAGFTTERPAVFHATNYVAHAFDVPVVATVHDLSFLRFPDSHPSKRLAWLDQYLPETLARAAHIIVPSNFTRNELLSLFPVDSSRVTVVYDGVSSQFRPRVQEEAVGVLHEYNLPWKGYILSVGTVEPRKNLVTLVRAYEVLPDSLKGRWPLVVVGGRGWKDEAVRREMAPLMTTGRLRYLGSVSHDTLASLYAAARVFVYPSLYEGFGLPPLEAMASGAPTVVSSRASLPEVTGRAAALIDPDDVEALARTLESLLEDPARLECMARMGLERARRFTWGECARETLKVYQRILGAAAPASGSAALN